MGTAEAQLPLSAMHFSLTLYFLKNIISKHIKILNNIPSVCLTSYLYDESKIIMLGGV